MGGQGRTGGLPLERVPLILQTEPVPMLSCCCSPGKGKSHLSSRGGAKQCPLAPFCPPWNHGEESIMAPGCLHYGPPEGLGLLFGPLGRGQWVSLRHPSKVPLREVWAVYVLLLQLQSMVFTFRILPTWFLLNHVTSSRHCTYQIFSDGGTIHRGCASTLYLGPLKTFLWVSSPYPRPSCFLKTLASQETP